MKQSVPVIEGTLLTPRVNVISMDQPWQWLSAGWRDTYRTPVVSLGYGAMFSVMGYLLVAMVGHQFHLSLALVTGFLLVGPFLIMGVYDMSMRLERNEPPSVYHALTAWKSNFTPTMMFGLLLGILMVIWARLSAVLFGVVVGTEVLTVGGTVESLFFTDSGFVFLMVFTVVGGVLAAAVFTVSVVSIPMMLDRKCDFITAVLTSIKAVTVNPGPMLMWAGLIVVFTGIGMATFFLGLALTLPIIGHATWHAYRSVVVQDGVNEIQVTEASRPDVPRVAGETDSSSPQAS